MSKEKQHWQVSDRAAWGSQISARFGLTMHDDEGSRRAWLLEGSLACELALRPEDSIPCSRTLFASRFANARAHASPRSRRHHMTKASRR